MLMNSFQIYDWTNKKDLELGLIYSVTDGLTKSFQCKNVNHQIFFDFFGDDELVDVGLDLTGSGRRQQLKSWPELVRQNVILNKI
jgi:hypothetical protein